MHADLLAFVDAVFMLAQYAIATDDANTDLTEKIKSRAMKGQLIRVKDMVG
jgi:hypothetical protein